MLTHKDILNLQVAVLDAQLFHRKAAQLPENAHLAKQFRERNLSLSYLYVLLEEEAIALKASEKEV